MRSAHLLLMLPLLLVACEPAEVEVNPAPPVLGFGDTEGPVPVTGQASEARILWTKATDKEELLDFSLEGEGASMGDLQVLTPSPLRVPRGATEIAIQLKIADTEDPDRIERKGLIRLLPGDWFRLSQRDTFSFEFSVPHTARLTLWAPEIAFPVLWGYSSGNADPVPPGRANRHFAFGHASTTQANVIGMFNTQPEKSTNALNMHRLYSDYDVSSASANIRIPNLFRLIPERPGGTSGRVEVIEQRVTITRKASSMLPPFTIGISGEGTYDENTGIISVAVLFDESELGIAEPVLRRYSYESMER